MAYRPQFALPAPPPGCRYESFVYCFDESNCPALVNLNLAAGESVLHIPLHLDDDAEFLWFATKVDASPLGIYIETPWTEPIMSDYEPATQFAETDNTPSPLEPYVHCPAGSLISLSLKNLA